MKLAIMLDPGHGGADSGATGNGLLEKDLNWKTAVNVRDLLSAAGFSVNLTRNEDELPSLQERAKRAKDWGADLLISIHHNAGGGTGYEIYKTVKGTIDDNLALSLAREYERIGQKPHGDGIYSKILSDGSDYYGILRYSASLGLPAIISEYAYIDSADAQKLSDAGLNAEGEAIARAVCAVCGVEFTVAQAETGDEASKIAQALAAKGWSSSPDYWANAMRGKQVPSADYLTALLGKAVQKDKIDEAQKIADALAVKGWSRSPDYWANAMRGKQAPSADYLTALLKKATGI